MRSLFNCSTLGAKFIDNNMAATHSSNQTVVLSDDPELPILRESASKPIEFIPAGPMVPKIPRGDVDILVTVLELALRTPNETTSVVVCAKTDGNRITENLLDTLRTRYFTVYNSLVNMQKDSSFTVPVINMSDSSVSLSKNKPIARLLLQHATINALEVEKDIIRIPIR